MTKTFQRASVWLNCQSICKFLQGSVCYLRLLKHLLSAPHNRLTMTTAGREFHFGPDVSRVKLKKAKKLTKSLTYDTHATGLETSKQCRLQSHCHKRTNRHQRCLFQAGGANPGVVTSRPENTEDELYGEGKHGILEIAIIMILRRMEPKAVNDLFGARQR